MLGGLDAFDVSATAAFAPHQKVQLQPTVIKFNNL
jgi:hypothetical protein